jgi:hypothetical protein
MSHTIYAVKFQQTIIHQHYFLLFLLSFQCVRSLRFENTVDSSVILGYTVVIDRLTFLQQSSHRTPITSRHHSGCRTFQKEMIHNDTSNMSSFFRFVTKRAIYLDLQRSNRTEAKLLQLQILHTCIHKCGVLPIVRRLISPTTH